MTAAQDKISKIYRCSGPSALRNSGVLESGFENVLWADVARMNSGNYAIRRCYFGETAPGTTYDDVVNEGDEYIQLTISSGVGTACTKYVYNNGAWQNVLLGEFAADDANVNAGAVVCKRINTTALEALLDTDTNNLFAVKEGDEVLAVKLFIQAAAGAACSVTIGTDVDVDGTTADVDAYLKAGDANATGVQSSDDVAATYMGADLAFGSHVVDGDGYITITSSTDQSSSSFVGQALVFYIPAQ